MGSWKSVSGLLDVNLTSASIAYLLTSINNAGITMREVKYVNELNAVVTIYRCDYSPLQTICRKMESECRVVKQHGVYWVLKKLTSRPVLVIGTVMLLFLILALPGRILFVCVEGNETIPANLIVEKAEACGIYFGSERAVVRSEKMKNELLSLIPELQWVGINTYGCVAMISVQERQEASNEAVHAGGVSNVVATRDGVIHEMTTFSGNPLCKPGQAVTKGQVLVSGYIDCGAIIKGVRANAEIKAKTQRFLEVIAPYPSLKRGEPSLIERNYSLILGKKLINLYKGSGISNAGCVKICVRHDIMLPGGFRLPIALVEECIKFYKEAPADFHDGIDRVQLATMAGNYLHSQMLAGQVLKQQMQFEEQSNSVQLIGTYECLEIIGKIQCEENLQIHGTSD